MAWIGLRKRRAAASKAARDGTRRELALDPRSVLWLLLSFALVVGPHAERLPLWVSGLVVLLAGWRGYVAQRGRNLPAKWLLLLAGAAVTGAIYFSYGTIFGRDAGVALLIVMLALKLLETTRLRDAMVIVLLCYFAVITNFLYSQSIATAGVMLLAVLAITTTMIRLHHASPGGRERENIRIAGSMLAQSIPLMLIFFLLFPRVQGPLWGLPQDAYSGVTGLSDNMTPGSLSQLGLSDAVAFRVNFTGDIPKAASLYWRGPVMWYFDGATWHIGLSFDSSPAKYQADSPATDYVVTLEPHNRRWLFALDLPGKLPPNARATADFQIFSATPVRSRIRYEMTSHLAYRASPDELNPFERRRALQLPEGVNWRTRSLAANMRKAALDDRDLIRAVLAMFRTQQFYYTLSPPLLGEDPVDDFLFNTKRGFCEHYASSFVFLMRAAGIPARVVTGYQGGEINPVGNYVAVRQSDAHAWAEVWIKDDGWTRIDPTAAVSPLRVEAGLAAAIPAGAALPLLGRSDNALVRQLRFTWDSVANSWNQWVLGYNPERQVLLLSRVGMNTVTWQNLVIALLLTTAIVTLTLALLLLRRIRQRTVDRVTAAYSRYCRKLSRKGMARGGSEGPLDYATRIALGLPDKSSAVREISDLYVELRYGRLTGAEPLARLERMVENFNP